MGLFYSVKCNVGKYKTTSKYCTINVCLLNDLEDAKAYFFPFKERTVSEGKQVHRNFSETSVSPERTRDRRTNQQIAMKLTTWVGHYNCPLFCCPIHLFHSTKPCEIVQVH